MSAMDEREDEPAREPFRGVGVDEAGRCVHWCGELDIVSFRFPCCAGWWPCHACHEEVADHPAQRWAPDDFTTRAVRCGACDARLPISAYLASPGACPRCAAPFNPGCVAHHPRYFRIRTGD